MAAFHVIQESVWVKGVLGEMGLMIDPITLHMNSKSVICLAKNSLYHKRSKQIDIKYHWIREKLWVDIPQFDLNILTHNTWMLIFSQKHWSKFSSSKMLQA